MYNRYQNLLFFNKKGDPLSFVYNADKGVWTGAIHMPEVPSGLVENETIYIVDQIKKATGRDAGAIYYVFPHANIGTENPSFIAKMKNGKQDLYLFTVDNPSSESPKISMFTEINGELDDNSSDYIDDGYVYSDASLLVDKPMRFDIAAKSNKLDVLNDILQISDSDGVFAEIEIYTEVVREDDRLNMLLSNFGEQLNEKHEYIFRESDINEDLPNYKILNEKRKELMIQLNQLAPYYSSIKGIVYTLSFFGYYDIRLKEYWKDIDNNKYLLNDVVINEYDKLDSKKTSPQAPYIKTPYFGLFYDINKIVEGEFDQYGLPITEDSFTFSNEEIILKLFGLKKYIEERNIGGNARIVDIIGEAFYFNRYEFDHWFDESESFVLDEQIVPSFSSNPTDGYLSDLRPYLYDFSLCPLPQNLPTSGGGDGPGPDPEPETMLDFTNENNSQYHPPL